MKRKHPGGRPTSYRPEFCGSRDIQDQAVTENMGEIVDRTLEHPAVSDRMIVRTKRRLSETALALKDGVVPPESTTPIA